MPKRITREQILDATIEVLLERGYAGSTTRHIAERAEISEVTLFRRFGSKAKLVVAAVEHSIAERRVKVEYTGDVEQDLVSIIEQYHRGGRSRRAMIMPLVLSEIPRHPELAEALDAAFENVSAIGALLVRYQQEGVLPEEVPMHAAACLLGPLVILRMLSEAAPQREIPTLELRAFVRAFLHGRISPD